MNRNDAVQRLTQQAAEIRRRFAVKELAVFGSIARDEARPGSDIDVLVTFDGKADFDRFMDLKFYLEELLGVRVDLVTRSAMRPELLPRIEREAIDVS